MAGIAKIVNVTRPSVEVLDGAGQMTSLTEAAFLLVTIDLNSNGRNIFPIELPFATYAGLESEWLAGSATTVLEAAVTTHLNGAPAPLIDRLSSSQRAAVGVSITIA